MKKSILKNSFYRFIKRSRNIFLLLFFILLSGCTSASIITVFYSGNINGVIEDCKCPKTPEGSILNHVTFYKDSIKNIQNKIYLCSGNYFGYNHNDKDNIIVSDILDSLAYDLISFGKNDLYFIDTIKTMPIVSFNILGAVLNKTFKINNIKIAITGMTDPEYSKYYKENIIQDKSIPELKDFIDSLKYESDVVIFISNLESDKEKRIFNEIKNIDIMISNTNQNNEELYFGKRLYLSSGSSAEFVGKLILSDSSEGIRLKNSFTKMKYDIIKEDQNLKTFVDSLRIKYGIKSKPESIDQDL